MSQYITEGKLIKLSGCMNINKQNGSMAMTMGFTVVIVALILASLFVYKKNQKEIELLNQYLAQVETNLGQKESALTEFSTQLAKVSADVEAQDSIYNDHLRALEANLEKVGGRVNKLESNSSQEWLLSEVEYLMKMADNRMLMKEDVKGAIALLKNAEKVLTKMPVADSGLNNVRIAISKDIVSMEVFKGVNVPGTYSQLVALSSLIGKLPMIPLETAEVPEGVEEVSEDNVVGKINGALGDYLTVRRYSVGELEKMLTADQRSTLKDSVKLSIEQASTALLRGEQVIYDDSLQKVRNALLNYFDASDYRVDMAKVKLDKLVDVKVEKQLPSIASSQQELKRYLSDRMRAGTL